MFNKMLKSLFLQIFIYYIYYIFLFLNGVFCFTISCNSDLICIFYDFKAKSAIAYFYFFNWFLSRNIRNTKIYKSLSVLFVLLKWFSIFVKFYFISSILIEFLIHLPFIFSHSSSLLWFNMYKVFQFVEIQI